MWHSNNLVFGFLAHSSPNPWNLCRDECLLYANEVTGSWGSLDSFWKALAGGTNLVVRRVERAALSLGLQGEERPWKFSSYPVVSDLINHAYVLKPP